LAKPRTIVQTILETKESKKTTVSKTRLPVVMTLVRSISVRVTNEVAWMSGEARSKLAFLMALPSRELWARPQTTT